ncbi:hypothetical protein AJ79_05920 [Helicocarpus griseus UAMH5409]|uniref:Uncharacterized protein n=1 Tax=Helicocarpus griseus UAMH5409 TaxID=1447875 RepID=A0A2B7XII3_9EURO|nr:hypothetical protein AJ79_05920 [Helicocarpus griseus UAMH5409]
MAPQPTLHIVARYLPALLLLFQVQPAASATTVPNVPSPVETTQPPSPSPSGPYDPICQDPTLDGPCPIDTNCYFKSPGGEHICRRSTDTNPDSHLILKQGADAPPDEPCPLQTVTLTLLPSRPSSTILPQKQQQQQQQQQQQPQTPTATPLPPPSPPAATSQEQQQQPQTPTISPVAPTDSPTIAQQQQQQPPQWQPQPSYSPTQTFPLSPKLGETVLSGPFSVPGDVGGGSVIGGNVNNNNNNGDGNQSVYIGSAGGGRKSMLGLGMEHAFGLGYLLVLVLL